MRWDDVERSRRQFELTVSEDDVLRQAIETVRLHSGLVVHFRPAGERGRVVTPLQGDPGSPDLLAVVGRTVILAEFKREQGRLSQAQLRWGYRLAAADTLRYLLVRPSTISDFHRVVAEASTRC